MLSLDVFKTYKATLVSGPQIFSITATNTGSPTASLQPSIATVTVTTATSGSATLATSSATATQTSQVGPKQHVDVRYEGFVISITQNYYQVSIMGEPDDPSQTLKNGNVTYVMYDSSSNIFGTIQVGSTVIVSGWLKGPTEAGVTPSGYQVSIIAQSGTGSGYYIEIKIGAGCC